jgi:hypothetical protein
VRHGEFFLRATIDALRAQGSIVLLFTIRKDSRITSLAMETQPTSTDYSRGGDG